MNELIKIEERDGSFYTTSLNVSEVTGKQHKHVLETIRKMIEERPELDGSRFRPSSYINSQNRSMPMYEIDRRGIVTLLFRMTGEKAFQFQEDYMDVWDDMEEALRNQTPQLTIPKDYPSALRAIATEVEQKLLAQQEVKQLEHKVEQDTPKVDAFDCFLNAEGLCDMNVAAKSIGWGRNKLLEKLRTDKIFISDNTPAQRYMNDGRFKVVHDKALLTGRIYPHTMLTAKGLYWLFKNYKVRNPSPGSPYNKLF